MKLLNLKLLFLSLFSIAFTFTTQAATERVVATVNGNPILRSQVTAALAGQKDNEANRKKALDSIIEDLLVKQAIGQSQVTIDPAQIIEIMENIAAEMA